MLMVLEANLSGDSCRNALGPDPPRLGLQVQPICLPPHPNSSRAEEEGDTPVFCSKAARKMYPLEGTTPRQNKPATTKNFKTKSPAMETVEVEVELVFGPENPNSESDAPSDSESANKLTCHRRRQLVQQQRLRRSQLPLLHRRRQHLQQQRRSQRSPLQ